MNDHKQSSSARMTSSAAVWMLACLVIANVALKLTPLPFDNFAYPYKSWSWWCMNDLRKSTDRFNTALVGSSLVVTSNSGCDANFLGRSINLTEHHRASYLDHALSKTFGGEYQTFNLSAPGQMASDAYLSLKAAFSIGQKPQAIVYCVGPRDFIDATLPSPGETELIGYLSRIVDVHEVASDLFLNPFDRLNWILQQYVPIYGHAADFQIASTDAVNCSLTRFAPKPAGGKPYVLADRRRILPDFNKAETLPEISEIRPIEADQAAKLFSDNSGEYIERYADPHGTLYETERKFFNRTTELCRREGVMLVVVNMPLLAANKELLPADFLDKYKGDLQSSCKKDGALLLDLSDSSEFKQSDFQDPVHLNGIGGRKLYDTVLKAISNNSHFSRRLALAGSTTTKLQRTLAERTRPIQ